jgi:hypothetical protein
MERTKKTKFPTWAGRQIGFAPLRSSFPPTISNLNFFWLDSICYKPATKSLRSTSYVIESYWLYQYSETNVMHLLFHLLSIKELYMFRASLTHPQQVQPKRHLVYCVRVMSVGCTRIEDRDWSFRFNPGAANIHNTHTICQLPFVWRLLKMSK